MDTSQKEQSLSAKLRALRAEYNLTQQQVAEKLGVSQQTYSNYEKKACAVDSKVLKSICDLYSVSADYLLGMRSNREREVIEDRSYESADIGKMAQFMSRLMTEMKKSDDTNGEDK